MFRKIFILFTFLVLTGLLYRGILFPSGRNTAPWGSDTLGHILKVEYLKEQVKQGVLYPNLFPGWYMGVQLMRYHPPLPYYLLLLLSYLTPDVITAGNWLVALCALAGGLSWLLYERWIGWLPAAAGGFLYLFLPDNLRVALAEGNLPRALATALLPLAVYFLLRVLDGSGTRRHLIALGMIFTAILLSHAMMAAIYAACAALLAVLTWIGRAVTFRRVILAVVGIVLGILAGGWWFLPSLTGGITELNAEAVTEGLAVVPLTDYLSPWIRITNPEGIYPGAALLLLTVLSLFLPQGRTGWSTALALTGLFGVLISTPGFNTLFNALPMHNLFWPIRFLGIASTCLLLSLAWRFHSLSKNMTWSALLVVGLLLADHLISTRLVYLRPPHTDIMASADQIARLPGWREATLDFSRLGSAASYYYTAQAQREQLFGWAYQGARTALNVAGLNEALTAQSYPYLLDRLSLFGADDLIFLNSELRAPLPDLVTQAGYSLQFQGPEVTLFHRDGAPRALLANWRVLGIGKGAQNLAYLYPEIILGSRTQVDAYSLEELTAYPALFLSGFDWLDRAQAEERIRQAAQAGVKIVVDITGIPEDPLARRPRFLEVWGEPILTEDRPVPIQVQGKEILLRPALAASGSWQSLSPQGLQVETIQFNYISVASTLLGYNEYGAGKVWFVGFNLPYRVFLNHDPFLIQLFSELLDISYEQPNAYRTIPIDDYRPSDQGYSFTYVLDQGHALLIPVAYHEGTEVWVDGVSVSTSSIENLVQFEAPAGSHRVEIQVGSPWIYQAGQAASLVGLTGWVITAFLSRKGGK